jgi:hypothetical protein
VALISQVSRRITWKLINLFAFAGIDCGTLAHITEEKYKFLAWHLET